MTLEQVELLCVLTYLYLARGQKKRAIATILLCQKDYPDHVGVLRLLAYAYIVNGRNNDALEVIQRLEKLDTSAASAASLLLLKSKALHRDKRFDEAKNHFSRFISTRLGNSA